MANGDRQSVAITAPLGGFVETWTAPIIGFYRRWRRFFGVPTIEKYLRRSDRCPLGPRSGRYLGEPSRSAIFASPHLTISAPGIWYGIFGDVDFGATSGQLGFRRWPSL